MPFPFDCERLRVTFYSIMFAKFSNMQITAESNGHRMTDKFEHSSDYY